MAEVIGSSVPIIRPLGALAVEITFHVLQHATDSLLGSVVDRALGIDCGGDGIADRDACWCEVHGQKSSHRWSFELPRRRASKLCWPAVGRELDELWLRWFVCRLGSGIKVR